jgi:hypothetical protein
VIQDHKLAKKFRQRQYLRGWMRYMNFEGDFLLMSLKAKRYHQQALSSKALLSLYSHTLKQHKI